MATARRRPSAARRPKTSLPTVVDVAPRTGALAVRLLEWAREAGQEGLIHVSASERRAEALGRLLRDLAPDVEVVVLPAWDCLPYDRSPPSRDVMGRRVVALARLARAGENPRILLATPDALVQRVPGRGSAAKPPLILRRGEGVQAEELASYLRDHGFSVGERVDEAGEAAIQGQVIDVAPPGAPGPVRIEHEDGIVTAIRSFDPVSQLTIADVDEISLYPAAEHAVTLRAVDESDGAPDWLPPPSAKLATLFDYLPAARIVADEKAEERRQALMEQIADAYEARRRRGGPLTGGPVFPPPDRLYMSDREWIRAFDGRSVTVVREGGTGLVPPFAQSRKAGQEFAAFLKHELKAKRRVVLAAATEQDLRALSRRAAQALGRDPKPAADWRAVAAARPSSLLRLKADFNGGFVDEDSGTAVVAAADLFGSRARAGDATRRPSAPLAAEPDLRIGDAVIHLDRGMGRLAGLDALDTDGAAATDLIRLQYADDEKLLAPVEDMERIWRYGASDRMSLDRLESEAWPKRRERIEADIADTAKRLVDLARERERKSAPKLVPPRQAYERFVARFPFSETPDQLLAIEDVLEDLGSGRPMDRLVCGDVGFGKTEVALRAAAAAALAGKQVAVVAPTTVLVRQHLHTFQRRFAGLGIEVAHLSRLVTAAEARAVKKGIGDGSVRVVIGTHALAGKGVRFEDLGLLIIDEEQRFGIAHKRQLRGLAADVHVLTLTATPIPRTLQAAMLGLQELSIIATPPAQRRPIRTFVATFDEVTVRQALLRERDRGGQSFVVCPRVEDIAPMRARLAKLVPELQMLVAHGKMPASDIDDAMVRFAEGDGDVLLATNIIESGLDVPRANTMLVWRADRFGLAQLHQLRGRVGRGRVRGVAYLFTDPAARIAAATQKRLRTLETLDRLGAGFDVSARDLDARGAGDLFGEEQAGHIKLIGIGLYRHLLARALAAARGKPVPEDWSPELNIGAASRIPADYVPDEEARINLYARLSRIAGDADLEALSDEIEDRFGPQPAAVGQLFLATRLKQLCRRAGIARIDAGPQAVAVTFRRDVAAARPVEKLITKSKGTLAWRGERLVYTRSAASTAEQQRIALKLVGKLAAVLAE